MCLGGSTSRIVRPLLNSLSSSSSWTSFGGTRRTGNPSGGRPSACSYAANRPAGSRPLLSGDGPNIIGAAASNGPWLPRRSHDHTSDIPEFGSAG